MQLRKNNVSGYTLVELLIVLGVVAFLAAVATPSWQHLTLSNHMTTNVNHFVTAINLTRSEAIKRGMLVGFCASRDLINCGGHWEEGQIIFIDKLAQGQPQSPSDILYKFNGVKFAKVMWHSFGKSESLQMLPTGFTNEQNGSFVFCPGNNDTHFARGIIVSKSGRIRLTQDINSDGFHEDATGEVIACN